MGAEIVSTAENGLLTLAVIFGTGLAAFISYFRRHGGDEAALVTADKETAKQLLEQIENLTEVLEKIADLVEDDIRDRREDRIVRLVSAGGNSGGNVAKS